ncbi:hypothetical protein RBA41_28195 [Massilia sp. CCM 9210]|uniref:hypothetical protein n=1 Tax=Massilia scottii TaxID=3057166 RepID=UPI002796562B|nr:hypothetical protein [Massilia sp. CCM 9210]MDQ1817191.1 hypothetical protein [Massilia sp. CCM 9210]
MKTTPACRHATYCVACANFPDGAQILRELLAIVGNDGYAMTALTLGGYRKDLGTTIANYLDLYTSRHERLDRATAPRQ